MYLKTRFIMGKSITGGTRAYLRGRVGSDVYSIGRNSKGKKQQVVRSLAETVANPQTKNQMIGRMIMSTIMQACAELRPIIDHSFDGMNGRQPNISEFIRRNYALAKADYVAHPSSGNEFGAVKYGEKGAKQGAYVISSGKAVLPTALTIQQASGAIVIALPAGQISGAGLRAALGLNDDEYFTLVGIQTNGQAAYERFRINPAFADATPITMQNVATAFLTEGNVAATIGFDTDKINIQLSSVGNCCAVIISKQADGGYLHNDAVLGAGSSLEWPWDTALATYPVGSQDYLNGGDILGMNESQQAGGSTPEPTPQTAFALTISKTGSGTLTVTAGGQAVTSGQTIAAGTEVTISATKDSGGDKVEATLNGSAVSLTEAGGTYSGTFTMPSQASTLNVDTAASDIIQN